MYVVPTALSQVRTLKTVIRNDTIRYDSAYYTHMKSPKINRGTLIKTLQNSIKY